MVAFEGEVAAGHEVDFGVGQVAAESLGSGRDERRIVLTPNGEQWGLMGAQILVGKMFAVGAFRLPERGEVGRSQMILVRQFWHQFAEHVTCRRETMQQEEIT